MKTAVLQVRLDADLKEQAETIFKEIGLSTTNAVRLILKQVVNHRKIPFHVVAEDPFYSEENQKAIREAIAEVEAGNYTVRELIEVEDE